MFDPGSFVVGIVVGILVCVSNFLYVVGKTLGLTATKKKNEKSEGDHE